MDNMGYSQNAWKLFLCIFKNAMRLKYRIIKHKVLIFQTGFNLFQIASRENPLGLIRHGKIACYLAM